MMQANIRQTVFEVEPAKSIVNVGSSTAYQICVTPGRSLGSVGTLEDLINEFAEIEVSNEPNLGTDCARDKDNKEPGSWFRRALATLGR